MRIRGRAIFVVTWILLVVCCSTSRISREERLAKQAKVEQMVDDSIGNRSFTIDINYVVPNRMPARHLEYGYYIRLYNDSVDAYIPFFGVAYRAEYGTNDEGIKYKGPISGFSINRINKDIQQVNIIAKKPLDEILYQIDIYKSGSATVFVRSMNRESIRFSGEMVLNEQ